jgi:hypothetical protein
MAAIYCGFRLSIILLHSPQASPSLHSALADPPYNVPSTDDVSPAVSGDNAYVDQSTAFALAFACVKLRSVGDYHYRAAS